MKFDPNETIKNLFNLIENYKEAINTKVGLLDFVTSDNEFINFINQLQDYKLSLKRAALIYLAIAPEGEFDRGQGQHTDGVMLSSGNGIRVVLHKAPYEIMRDKQLRRQLSVNQSSPLIKLGNTISTVIDYLEKAPVIEEKRVRRTYIPTLRTSRTLLDNKKNRIPGNNDILQITTIDDYDLAKENLIVESGLALFDALDAKRNGDLADRDDFSGFENFLSETFFNNKRVVIVPKRPKKSDNTRGGNIVVEIERHERDIQHLGDGIQAIILLLYPLFIAKKGEWFFIEEPETHLHPGFQRLFIETLLMNKILQEKELTFFLTTHSNHILDFVIDEAKRINLFTFQKTKETANEAAYSIQTSESRDISHLTALGVQNSSIFLANCTIWVEGITDRIYLKSYLNAYLDKLRLENSKQVTSLIDGLHYSFFEYAGANVAHYSFDPNSHEAVIEPKTIQDIRALSISNRIMLIADYDAGKKTARDNKLTNQQHNGFIYKVLAVREIENLLLPKVITGVLNKTYRSEKNAFDSTVLTQKDYEKRYLGEYLLEKFPSLSPSFAAASGTLASKKPFAEKAAALIISWEDVSPAAQKLTKLIYDFIVNHNPRLGKN